MAQPTAEEFLSSYSPQVQQLAWQARALVLEAIPGVQEIVDPPSKIIAYGFSPRYTDLVCAIAPYTGHVNLIFGRGVELPDPGGLLAGTGKKARHVKCKTLEDIQRTGVRALIAAAAALAAYNDHKPAGGPP